MSMFYYKALNGDGQEVSGEMEANSSASVNKALREAGLFPTEVLDHKAYRARTAPPKPSGPSTASRLVAAARTPIQFAARYPALDIIVRLYRGSAFVAGVIALLGAVRGLYMLKNINEWPAALLLIGGSLSTGFIAVITAVAISEGIKVFLDIEQHIRRLHDALTVFLEKL